MNEEEKQAIEKFSNLMTKHFEDKKIDTSDYLDYFEAITILNLIEKQQKEIEILKDKLKEIITEFIPKSNHEVILRAKLIKLIKLLGENKK